MKGQNIVKSNCIICSDGLLIRSLELNNSLSRIATLSSILTILENELFKSRDDRTSCHYKSKH